jgi:hypothetical protein
MKNDFLILIIFFAFLTIIAVGNDSYTIYQKHHTFQVAYESAMNCRAAIAKNGTVNALGSVEKTCGSIPRWEDYSK